MNNFIKNLKSDFKSEDNLKKLLYINIGAYLFIQVIYVLSFLLMFDSYNMFVNLTLPADYTNLIKRPWAIITYMFLHKDLLHILLNLLWLHFGGKLFLQYMNQKQLLSTYILGGVSGALLFILSYNLLPAFSEVTNEAIAIGASASVLAIIFSSATYNPNLSINLPFIGLVKIKYIAIFIFIIDVLSIPKGNSGGHISHIGGALFGFLYVKQLQRGNDLSQYLYSTTNYIRSLFGIKNMKKAKEQKNKTDQQYRNQRFKKNKQIDTILEKIAASGYESLSKEEKNILFKSSKR